VVSHDLCQPLRVVGGYAALLAHRHAGDLDEEARGYVERLAAGADSMQRLVDDLLDYARVGKGALARGPVAMGKVATAVITDLSPQIDSVAATVEVGPLPDVLGDARQLGRVFENPDRQRAQVPRQAAAGDRRRRAFPSSRSGTSASPTTGSGFPPRIASAPARLFPAARAARRGLGQRDRAGDLPQDRGTARRPAVLGASEWGGTVVHFTLPRN